MNNENNVAVNEVVAEATQVAETVADAAQAAAPEVAKAVEKASSKMKNNGIAAGVGFVSGIVVIAAAKPVWKLGKRAVTAIGSKVKGAFKKSETPKDQPAGEAEAKAEAPEVPATAEKKQTARNKK